MQDSSEDSSEDEEEVLNARLFKQFNCRPCYLLIDPIPPEVALEKMNRLCQHLEEKRRMKKNQVKQDEQETSSSTSKENLQQQEPEPESVAGPSSDVNEDEICGRNDASYFDDEDELGPKSSPESFGSDPPTPSGSVKLNGLTMNSDLPSTPTCSRNIERPSSILKKTKPVVDIPLTRGAVNVPSSPTYLSPSKKSVKWNVPPVDYVLKFKLKEFDIQLDVLTQEFIERAQSGSVNWKVFFRESKKEEDSRKVFFRDSKKEKNSRKEEEMHQKGYSNNKPKYMEIDELSYEMDDEDDNESDYTEGDGQIEEEYSDFEQQLTPKKGIKRKNTDTSASKTKGRPRKRRKTSEGDDEEKPKPVRRPRKTKTVFMHQCDTCSFSTSNIEELEEHVVKHGIELDTIHCKICGVDSFTVNDDKRHQYECHEGPAKLARVVIQVCKSCKQEFNDEKEFDCHIINHVMPNGVGYRCDICSTFTSIKYMSATDHVKTHVTFKCTFCCKTFNTLDQVERHCNQSHKEFGRPFNCNLCDFRSAVYGLLVRHREDEHAIIPLDTPDATAGQEKCKFCCESNFFFSSFEVMISHLAIHASHFHLYRCRECDFTADDTTKFHDHGMESHIALMLDHDEDIWTGPDLVGLINALSRPIKNVFGKNGKKSNVRAKPTFIETQSAVAGILGNEQVDEAYESRAYVSPELETMPTIEPQTLSEILPDLESNYTRPKRKSFVSATNKLHQEALVQQQQQQEKKRIQAEMRATNSEVDLPLQPDPSLPLNQTSLEQNSSLHQENLNTSGDEPILNQDVCLNEQDSSNFEKVYDDVNRHLYVNGSVLIDESGKPLVVEPDDVPNLINQLYSQMVGYQEPMGGTAQMVGGQESVMYQQQQPMIMQPMYQQQTQAFQPELYQYNQPVMYQNLQPYQQQVSIIQTQFVQQPSGVGSSMPTF